MSYGECQWANPECKYFFREPVVDGAFNGCYSDIDHILEKSQARTPLEKQFLHHSVNKRRLCRTEHDEWTITHPEPRKLDPEFMRGVLSGMVETDSQEVLRRIYEVS